MSVPVTPTAGRRRPMSQGTGPDGNDTTGSGSWLGAIGGVMGELLQSWGILGALRRRGWGTAGARSTPNTPPPFSRSSSPNHEQIELSHLNIQCRDSNEVGYSEASRIGGSCTGSVRRRRGDRSYGRPPRHSFHEGSSPSSYLLTAVLIHSLKNGYGNCCSEAHCHLCVGSKGASASPSSRLESHKDILLDAKQWKKLGSEHYELFQRSISEESAGRSCHLDVTINPLHTSHETSLLNLSEDTRCESSPCAKSPDESFCEQKQEDSDFYPCDTSSLTDVTFSSDLLYGPDLISPLDERMFSSEAFLTANSVVIPSTESATSSSSCKETDASLSIRTDTGTLTDFLTGRTCCTSSFFGDDSFDSGTLSGSSFADIPSDRVPHPSMRRQVSAGPRCGGPLFLDASSLPCRLTGVNDATLERPVLMTSGSLVMVPRRPSLSSPVGGTPSSHFCWEENPCYLRVEGARPGQGHDFRATTLERPAWCDACAHLVFYHATTCGNCNLTCHEQCQNVVSLDCKSHSPDTDSLFQEDRDLACYCRDETLPVDEIEKGDVQDTEKGDKELNLVEVKEEVVVEEEEEEEEKEKIEGLNGREEEEKHEEEMLEKEIKLEPDVHFQQSTLKRQEVSTLRRTVRRIQSQAVDSDKIEEWVQKCPVNNVGLQIAKENDGGYRGCLRIHLNLSRPINIVAGTRPPSIYDILQEERTLEKTLTSFYMPRDAVKAIHITSKTTTREVIVALLRKFKVVDNPQKFALYERTYDTGQSMRAKLRRLSDNECPLVLAIAWNAQGLINKRLVLQENDTADIQWEAFSLPELDNFLRILDREEGEYKNQIRDKYSLLRYKIQAQLSKLNYGNT